MTGHSDALAPSTGIDPATPPPARRSATLAPPLAFATLRIALGLGIAADALLRGEDGPGIAAALWVVMVCLGLVAAARRADAALRRESLAWLAAAIAFAAGCAWRDAEMLRAGNVLAGLVCLGLAAATIHDDRVRAVGSRVTTLVLAFLRLARGAAAGVLPFLVRDLQGTRARTRAGATLWPVARVVAIVLVLLLVFGSLLRQADPLFASFVTLPPIDIETFVSHVIFIGFFSWVLAGVLRATLVAVDRQADVRLPVFIQLGRAETTAALATLMVLFGAFVAAQLGWLFGGERFLQARTGLTAAEYARQGFFQTVWVVVLVVPVLVGTRAALRADHRVVRRHTALSLPVIALVAAMIASAALRMRLYVRYYGLSTDRLYAMVFMAWLGIVLVWLAVTMVRERERWFAGGSLISGLFTLVALNVASPDLIVARINIHRAVDQSTSRPLDLAYLARLGGEAAPLVTTATLAHVATSAADATPADRENVCTAAHTLLRRWGPASPARIRVEQPAAWRWWNAGERTALRAVGEQASALWAFVHRSCVRPHPPGPASQR